MHIYTIRVTTSVRLNFLSILQEKAYFFLFYTSTFTKHPHQFIYSTHLFNKIFILLHFLLFSHSWPLSLSLSNPTTIIITQPPSSQNPDLSDPSFVIFFVSHSHDWSKLKPKPIQAKTQGWSERKLIKPIQAEVDANEEDQQRVNEKRRGWLNPLT